MDLSLACGLQLSVRFISSGKHQSASMSDRAHYWRYQLTMARSLKFESTHPALLVIWALVRGQNTHTHTGLNTASVDTRNVFLPYFCWCVRTAKVKHLSLFSLKLYICRTSLNSVITHTALLLQSMAMKSVIDMADNHCVYVWCGIDVLHQFSAILFYWHSSNNSCLKVLYGKVNSI